MSGDEQNEFTESENNGFCGNSGFGEDEPERVQSGNVIQCNGGRSADVLVDKTTDKKEVEQRGARNDKEVDSGGATEGKGRSGNDSKADSKRAVGRAAAKRAPKRAGMRGPR